MKPIVVTKKNMNPGARIRSWWHRKKLTGIIIEGVEIRPCWWNFNSYCKQYVSSFEDESIIVKWDNGWENQMGQNIETVPVDRCVFLEKITTIKERKRPDFDKMLKHWDNSDLQELYDYLDKKLSYDITYTIESKKTFQNCQMNNGRKSQKSGNRKRK